MHILELGDFSITYRVSGLLTEVKGLLTVRSNLFRAVLETLHGQGIEIMSPAFMNQRRLGEEEKIIPKFVQKTGPDEVIAAEEIVFDKAEKAEQLEGEKLELVEEIKKMETTLNESPGQAKETAREVIKKKRERLKCIEKTEASGDKGHEED